MKALLIKVARWEGIFYVGRTLQSHRRCCAPHSMALRPPLPRGGEVRLFDYAMRGAITSATTDINLMRMLRAGPAVSLNGSPTVSPTTAALWVSLPLPP